MIEPIEKKRGRAPTYTPKEAQLAYEEYLVGQMPALVVALHINSGRQAGATPISVAAVSRAARAHEKLLMQGGQS